ncbi:DUF6151 family protein [Ruegeria arenilitoris]|uniref:DUF6151 family protein n=1 Tax=Ruegeria arenilitoris TaxID=1173585 RepID=UPI0014815244|nr:DUF6151 family protein [Ruegeria arenilitoris]
MSRSSACDVAFSCSCGTMRGHITAQGVASGTHAECFCHDCRAAQLYFGQPDPAPGPVEVLQTTPEDVIFDTGSEQLALMKLSHNGMLRWYAKCCNAPLATTARTPKFPFVGFIVKRIANSDALGPVLTRGFVPGPEGKQSHKGLHHAVLRLVTRVVRSRLTGRWKKTPFFDVESNIPVVMPIVLSQEQRVGLYD